MSLEVLCCRLPSQEQGERRVNSMPLFLPPNLPTPRHPHLPYSTHFVSPSMKHMILVQSARCIDRLKTHKQRAGSKLGETIAKGDTASPSTHTHTCARTHHTYQQGVAQGTRRHNSCIHRTIEHSWKGLEKCQQRQQHDASVCLSVCVCLCLSVCLSSTHTHTHTHTHAHTRTHARTHALTHSLTLTLSHIHSLSHSLSTSQLLCVHYFSHRSQHHLTTHSGSQHGMKRGEREL